MSLKYETSSATSSAAPVFSSSSLLLASLVLSDTKVYEPYIRALLGTASHSCEVVVLKLRTRPENLNPTLGCRADAVFLRAQHHLQEPRGFRAQGLGRVAR